MISVHTQFQHTHLAWYYYYLLVGGNMMNNQLNELGKHLQEHVMLLIKTAAIRVSISKIG